MSQVDKKPPNLVEDWRRKSTNQRSKNSLDKSLEADQKRAKRKIIILLPKWLEKAIVK